MTAQEEIKKRAWSEARKANIQETGNNSVNASEALDWLAEEYVRLLLRLAEKEGSK